MIFSWQKKKQEKRKKEKEIAKLEEQLAELENKKSELENKMADPSVYSNGEKAKAVQRDLDQIIAQIDEVTEQWMLISE